MFTENPYLVVSLVLFLIGCIGVLTRRNLLVVLMAIELMLNAANLAFLSFTRSSPALAGAGEETMRRMFIDGNVVVFFVIAVAAAEAAVGLAIVVALFRKKETVNLDRFTALHQ